MIGAHRPDPGTWVAGAPEPQIQHSRRLCLAPLLRRRDAWSRMDCCLDFGNGWSCAARGDTASPSLRSTPPVPPAILRFCLIGFDRSRAVVASNKGSECLVPPNRHKVIPNDVGMGFDEFQQQSTTFRGGRREAENHCQLSWVPGPCNSNDFQGQVWRETDRKYTIS